MLASLTRPHSEQLLQGLQLLRQDHELCDIVLRVGDAKIHAHKVVLASISPYFKAMFTGNLSEKETSEVEFQCIDEAALQVTPKLLHLNKVPNSFGSSLITWFIKCAVLKHCCRGF